MAEAVMVKYESRRTSRRRLAVNVAVTDVQSGVEIVGRTEDLSLHGCGVSTETPFPAGTMVMLNVAHGTAKITAFGKVIYDRQDIGMGIAFTSMETGDQKLIETWLAELDSPS
jgi:PilZ domain